MLKQAMYAAPIGALLAAGIFTGTALATEPPDTGPDTQACAAAQSDLTAAVELTTGFDPSVYPDGAVPTADQVTPALLNQVLGADLGAGAQAEVQAALDAFTAAGAACAEPDAGGEQDEGSQDEGSGTDPGTDDPGTDPGSDPGTDEDPPYETCTEAIDDGAIVPAVRDVDAAYQANLDSDGDGVACEAGEGTAEPTVSDDGDSSGVLGGSSSGSGSGTVDSIPSGSVDTGYVAP